MTIADQIKKGYEGTNWKYHGMTRGQYSGTLRKNSNLYQYLKLHDLLDKQILIRKGAKRRYQSEGTQLLIFVFDAARYATTHI